MATGLLLPGSDIDTSLNFRPSTKSNKKLLWELCDVVNRDRTFKKFELQPIPYAKIPVLIIDSLKYITSIDISFNNTSQSSDRTIIWIKQHPDLVPLYLVLKHSLLSLKHPLKNFQVMSSKLNGLASYSLICLIVHYLKYQKNDTITPSSPTYYADLLINILDFYSKFDYLHKGFQFDSDRPYFNKDNEKPYLYIKDPDIPDANVGRSTSMIEETKQCLKFLFKSLLKNINDTSIINSSILAAIIKINTEEKKRPEGREYVINQVSFDTQSLRPLDYKDRGQHLGKRKEAKGERTTIFQERQRIKRQKYNDKTVEEISEKVPPKKKGRKEYRKMQTESKKETKNGDGTKIDKGKKGDHTNSNKRKTDDDHAKANKKKRKTENNNHQGTKTKN
ncbi:unnamed protein product [Cunninghamella blakesleeana]